jgi:hypothetical protein
LDKTDRALLGIEGEKNHRLRAYEALGQEGAGQSKVRRLSIELPIAVEEGDKMVEVIGSCLANIHGKRGEESPNESKRRQVVWAGCAVNLRNEAIAEKERAKLLAALNLFRRSSGAAAVRPFQG